MNDIAPRELARRYVAAWNEPDAGRRRAAIQGLWAADGAHILQPPQEIRQAAAAVGFPAATLEARGHDALEIRVKTAYEEFVAPGKFTFRSRDNAERLADMVKFNWEMISTDGGEVAAVGLEIFILGEDGRIKTDYQFIEN
jgi:hypothetical protein